MAKYLIISSYLVLGVLKLNSTYLTGLWLQPWWEGISTKSMEWVAAIILVVELVVPLGLLFSRQRRFLISILILLIYHLVYGLKMSPMGALISIGFLLFFIFDFYGELANQREYIYQKSSSYRFKSGRMFPIVIVSLFLSLQWMPFWSESILSKGTFLRFSFDHEVEDCKRYNFVKSEGSLVDLGRVEGGCALATHFDESVALCRRSDPRHESLEVHSYLFVKNIFSLGYESQFQSHNICTVGLGRSGK